MKARQQGADQLPRTINQALPGPAQDVPQPQSVLHLFIHSFSALGRLTLCWAPGRPSFWFYFWCEPGAGGVGGGFSRAFH